MEQRKFLAMVGPLAQADMQKSGILASLTIAQAILESGWGASELATKANALFGIKADARWSGKAYSKDTKECYDGATYTTITALFRAYDSWAESVADHSAFLLANKRYAAVVGERDYKVACKAIKAAGYATDPGYPQKLIGLIEKYGLTVYDGKAEQEDKTSMNISITKKTSTHNTTAAAGRAIRYIVVHYTAGVTSKPGSAAGTASYFGSTSKQVSADFIVDDGGAVQYNGDIRNRYTWHCGGGKYNTKGGAYYGKATNRNTIGIEVCSTNDTGKMTVANDSHWRFTDKVVSNLVELVKYLMAEYGIDAAHVIRHYIETTILDKDCSPAAVLGFAMIEGKKFKTSLSVPTIYKYIAKGLFLNLTQEELPRHGKKKHKYKKVKKNKSASRAPAGESIEQRPEEIDEREEFGHWEGDTVYSGKGKRKTTRALLTLTERKTRKEIIIAIPNRKAETVVKALDALERKLGARRFRAIFKSITFDNGTEFAAAEELERSCINKHLPRTKVYFCHPYSSWERGTNENTNGMIRRRFPKGTNFAAVTNAQIAQAENWINNYPRKILGYKSSEIVFRECLRELGIAA
jgi:IS30 family transposase